MFNHHKAFRFIFRSPQGDIFIDGKSAERQYSNEKGWGIRAQNQLKAKIKSELALLKISNEIESFESIKIRIKKGDTIRALALAVDNLAKEKYKRGHHLSRDLTTSEHQKKDININDDTLVVFPNGETYALGDIPNKPYVYENQFLTFQGKGKNVVIHIKDKIQIKKKIQNNTVVAKNLLPQKKKKISKKTVGVIINRPSKNHQILPKNTSGKSPTTTQIKKPKISKISKKNPPKAKKSVSKPVVPPVISNQNSVKKIVPGKRKKTVSPSSLTPPKLQPKPKIELSIDGTKIQLFTKPKYRVWNGKTKKYEQKKFEEFVSTDESTQKMLSHILKNIQQKFKPGSFEQPLKFNLTHLGRVEIKDKQNKTWIITPNDVYEVVKTQAENKADYEKIKKEWNQLFEIYLKIREDLAQYTDKFEVTRQQNSRLRQIDKTASNKNFWNNFNKNAPRINMTFSKYKAFIRNFNTHHPFHPIISSNEREASKRAYQEWRKKFYRYNVIYKKLEKVRRSLEKAFRLSKELQIKDKKGRIWEEYFGKTSKEVTIIRELRDKNDYVLKNKNYDNGYLTWVRQYSYTKNKAKQFESSTSLEFSPYTLKPKARFKEKWKNGKFQKIKQENILPNGNIESVKDFQKGTWKFYLDEGRPPFIHRNLNDKSVFMDLGSNDSNINIIETAMKNPDKFLNDFAESIKSDPIRVKLRKIDLFLKAAFEYKYDTKDPNKSKFGTKENHGDLVRHYTGILSNNALTDKRLFGDDCDGYAHIAQTILEKAGVKSYMVATNGKYFTHATAIVIFKENEKFHVASIGTFGLDIDGNQIGMIKWEDKEEEGHPKTPFSSQKAKGYDTIAEGITAVFQKFKKDALKKGKEDGFAKELESEVKADFEYQPDSEIIAMNISKTKEKTNVSVKKITIKNLE